MDEIDTSIDDSVWKFGTPVLEDIVSKDVFREMVALRRKLHEHPELAFQEVFTSATGEKV